MQKPVQLFEYALLIPACGNHYYTVTRKQNPLNPIVHFWLHNTVHCEEKIVSVHLHRGRWVGSPTGCFAHGGCQARLGCGKAMFETRWATSSSDCMDRLRKHYSPCRVLVSGKKGCQGSERVQDNDDMLMSLHIVSYTWYNEREELGMSNLV